MLKRLLFISFNLILLFLLMAFTQLGNANENSKPAKYSFTRNHDKDGIIKVLLYYDMEGISGQNIITSIDFPRQEYFEARELLTKDVNAVIEGLYIGGVDSVFVVDAHGSFNPEPDILLDKMDKRAIMVYKNDKFDPYVDLLYNNNYDAIVAVAMHSKTNGDGFAEHTINLGTDWIFNNMSVNESEILAYSWGRIGIPLIFVSGDDKLAEQLSWMDWLEYVTVKKARGIDVVELFPLEETYKKLRSAASLSVQNIDKMKAIRLNKPILATLKVYPPADLSILENVPGINYDNQSVTFQANNFIEAYNGIRGFMDVAQSGYLNIVAQLYLNEGKESFNKFKESIFDIWINSKLEKQTSDEIDNNKTKNNDRLYFGSQ